MTADPVTLEDIVRWYGQPSPVRAPLRPGEAESAHERFRDKVVWREPERNREHTITLCCPWRAVWLTPGAYLGRPFVLPAGEYVVGTHGDDLFNVWYDGANQVALLGAAR